MSGKNGKPPIPAREGEDRELTRFQKSVLEEANRKISLRSDGRAQEATLADIIIRKLFQVATNGSVHALGHAIRNITEAQTLNQALIRQKVERGTQVKERMQQRLEQAIRDGLDPVWVVPHPDDVVIDEDEGWRMNGPVDEDGLQPIRQSVRMRDVFLLQAVLEERLSPYSSVDPDDVPAVDKPGSTSLVFAFLLNDSLAARFQKSIPQVLFEMTLHQRLTKRELLKATYRAWAAIGQPKPRGAVMPPWSEAGSRAEHIFDVLRTVFQQIRGGELTGDRAIADRLGQLLRE